MTQQELDTTLNTICGFWPKAGAHLATSPLTLGLWRKKLRPYLAEVVETAIEQYVMSHKYDPTLEDLLTAIDDFAEERSREDARNRPMPLAEGDMYGQILDAAASRTTSEDDKAWAVLHVHIYEQGWAAPNADARQAMAAAYRQFAVEHPTLAALAHLHAAGCEEEAQMLASGEIKDPAEIPVVVEASEGGDDDLPF